MTTSRTHNGPNLGILHCIPRGILASLRIQPNHRRGGPTSSLGWGSSSHLCQVQLCLSLALHPVASLILRGPHFSLQIEILQVVFAAVAQSLILR